MGLNQFPNGPSTHIGQDSTNGRGLSAHSLLSLIDALLCTLLFFTFTTLHKHKCIPRFGYLARVVDAQLRPLGQLLVLYLGGAGKRVCLVSAKCSPLAEFWDRDTKLEKGE